MSRHTTGNGPRRGCGCDRDEGSHCGLGTGEPRTSGPAWLVRDVRPSHHAVHMKDSIVADGPLRFAESEEYQKRRRELKQALAARYASRLEAAGFLRRLLVRCQRHREFRRELRRISPSPQSCWFGLFASRRAGERRRDDRRDDSQATAEAAAPLEPPPNSSVSDAPEDRTLDSLPAPGPGGGR